MSNDGRAVANFILDYAELNGRAISNLALQKIIYFCHAWSLVQLDKPLIKHTFEAWEFGPVLPYLYREFKKYDRSPIIGRAMKIEPNSGAACVVDYQFDEETRQLLEQTVEFYSRMRPGDLVELSHVEGGPWYKVWNHEATVNPGMKIANDAIRQFYARIARPFTAH